MSNLTAPHEPVIQARGIVATSQDRLILDAIDLDVYAGERWAILGGIESGKSLLLRILGGLYQPDSGTIRLFGETVATYDPYGIPWSQPIGFVSQNLGLRSNMTAGENIALPLIYCRGHERGGAMKQAAILLKRLGIDDMDVRPALLSPGEITLVSLARALVLEPRILLFDNPVVVLDVDHARPVIELLDEYRERGGLAVVSACSSEGVARIIGERIAALAHGRLEVIS